MWAWGRNDAGQLGDGTLYDRNTPVQVSGLTGVTAISAGGDASAAGAFSLALKSDGTVRAWGWNWYGQLGDGTTVDKLVPVQVSGLTGITGIVAGGGHSFAFKNDGTLWGWGWNLNWQCDGSNNQRVNPPVNLSTLITGVSKVSGGGLHSLAIWNNGVYGWGSGGKGQLGDGANNTSDNTPVLALTTASAIAGGDLHSIGLKSNGTVWAWGYNLYGQLGDGTFVDKNVPVQVSSLTSVTAISAGNSPLSMAQKSDGTLWAWGWNGYGALGDGTLTDSNIPVKVKELTD